MTNGGNAVNACDGLEKAQGQLEVMHLFIISNILVFMQLDIFEIIDYCFLQIIPQNLKKKQIYTVGSSQNSLWKNIRIFSHSLSPNRTVLVSFIFL